MSDQGHKGRKTVFGRRFRVVAVIYAALLVASHLTQGFDLRSVSAAPPESRFSAQVGGQTAEGPTGDREIELSAIVFGAHGDHARPPVILVHGSPGDATNFDELGPWLSNSGRTAYALDMPGFGRSSKHVSDYSARAYARYLLAFMDAEGIDRAHVVGWSNGGAVGLNAADIEPDRVASLTLLAAIACQETEGSGDYYFEHAKYAVGYGALVALPELIPHFGLLGPRGFRHAFIRNFWDTDQRPIRGIMESLSTPTLILHGRHDPLVSDWAAERHHELIPTSRLVMTGHSHFLPFMQPGLTADFLEEHFDRHDLPGVRPLTDTLIYAEKPGQPWFRSALEFVRSLPWPVVSAIFAVLALLRRETATALAGLLVGHGVVDFGVAFVGLFLGRLAQPRCPCARATPVRTSLGKIVWTAVSLLIAQVALSSGTGIGEAGPLGTIAAVLGVSLLLNILKRLPTRAGRRRLVDGVRRCLHHEWWPSWVLYALLLPHLLRLAVRHRSLTVWTCVNPGIHPGGGIVGESKIEILNGLDPACSLRQIIVTADPDREARAQRVRGAIEDGPSLGYPVVIKPESGERGDRVTIVRKPEELRRALDAIPETAIVQRYHPGPVELGVFWVRDEATIGNEQAETTQGSILAITRKAFPVLACDGMRTVREQILAHKRYRMQAAVFCDNLRDRSGDHSPGRANGDLDSIPSEGVSIVLTDIGNHVKGCRFEDGSDLITPELAEAIDRLARTWRGPNGEAFDYGRFDLRSSSDNAVRAGEDLAIIELNGVTSEATNLYDPSWSPVRALRMLGRQWSIAFGLGAARRARGAEPLGVGGVLRALRDARRQ